MERIPCHQKPPGSKHEQFSHPDQLQQYLEDDQPLQERV